MTPDHDPVTEAPADPANHPDDPTADEAQPGEQADLTAADQPAADPDPAEQATGDPAAEQAEPTAAEPAVADQEPGEQADLTAADQPAADEAQPTDGAAAEAESGDVAVQAAAEEPDLAETAGHGPTDLAGGDSDDAQAAADTEPAVEAGEHADIPAGGEPHVNGNAPVDAGEEHADGGPSGVPDLASALEAVLMVVDEPIPAVQLAQVLETPRVEVEETLHRLAAEYTEAGRGFDLRAVAGGWRFYSRPECAPVVERFILDGQQARLTQAALETLAVIAYRQPVSRARVSAIRGVNCDGVVRTLVNRGLIAEAGTEQESNALLYRTTTYFLERLGLQNLDDLPDIAPYLPEVDELDDAEEVAG
ncbi:MAG: SMC-Scp complex subunit ScpB [Streptosporangiales bacterium]|nr:SMC-Scp complex subunit ScpB [Streptosporangiales bacterium]